jgi:hypothetical protein
MPLQTTVTVATSLAPVNIELQIEAIKTWETLGFRIISVNASKEIKILQQHFVTVKFVEAQRDASVHTGKPLIYIDDILLGLKESKSLICGIVNSDIFLLANDDFRKFITDKSKNTFIFGSRSDVDSFNDLDGDEYFGGFDFFFFDSTIIKLFPKTDFCLGLPWWDFWVPLVPIIKGIPIKRLITPVAYHIRHKQNWDQNYFEKYGRYLATCLMHDDLPANFDQELKECFAYTSEPEIDAFGVCILNYLKEIPEHIFYTSPYKIETKAILSFTQYNAMRIRYLNCEKENKILKKRLNTRMVNIVLKLCNWRKIFHCNESVK